MQDAFIKDYYVNQSGTVLRVLIPGKSLMEEIESNRITKCSVLLNDGRRITSQQRKKIYATLADIAAHTGYTPDEQKAVMKYRYVELTGKRYFSLSNCSLNVAIEFINVLLDYALAEGVILKDLGIDRTDDIATYLWQCMKYRKCAVCGNKGEIHHVDTIGMGNNRRTVDDSQYRKICLCRIHHTEAHKAGMVAFESKYKVYGIVYK